MKPSLQFSEFFLEGIGNLPGQGYTVYSESIPTTFPGGTLMNSKTRKLLAFVTALVLMLSVAATALAAYNTIPYGAQGDEVRKMQNALSQKGFFRGMVDGKFGPATKKAVIAFQKSVSLTPDGKPGNKTLTALYHGASAINTHSDGEVKAALNIKDPRSIYYGMTGDRVRSLQLALRRAGYYNAAIDSVFGDNTLAAVRKFQSQHALKADGIAGVKTQAKLNMINQGHAQVGYAFVLGMGSKCPEVRSLQSWLSRVGYGPCTDANGFFGTSTRDLLMRWQQDHGRTPTGTMTEAEYNQTVAAP